MIDNAKIKLVIVFNHRFERNLPLLERLYGERFSRRHILMPFASKPSPTISRVFEIGHNFQGHIAQGARDFIDDDTTHYVFIGDDLLLSPSLNDANILTEIGLKPGEGYIKNMIAADAVRDEWIWAGEATAKFIRNEKQLDIKGLLPTQVDAGPRAVKQGLNLPERVSSGVKQRLTKHLTHPRLRARAYLDGLTLRGKPAPYPLIAGYSDFLIVPSEAMTDFSNYCGAFAALNVFAEVAIPTAMMLACDAVRTELAPNQHFRWQNPERSAEAKLRGIELWTKEDEAKHRDFLDLPLPEMLDRFPKDWLYIHPVKLSRFSPADLEHVPKP